MRVLMLTGGGISNRSGGVGTMMAALRQAWGSSVDAHVIDTRGPGGRFCGAVWFAAALLRFLTFRQVDIVHLHMTTRGSMVRKCILLFVCRIMRRPPIVHMHGADFFDHFAGLPAWWRALLRGSLRSARYVVVLGEVWRRFLIDRVGLDAPRVVVVRNGVALPDRSPVHEGPIRLLFLGRLGDRKGTQDLVAALASPAMARRSWRATLAGDGDLDRFSRLVVEAGLAARVDLPGWVEADRAAALTASADVLVLPSFHEALPMAVVEALAHGVAVVTTPVGVVPEILSDEVNALLVPPGDVPALTAALVRLIDDAPLRARLAAAGHRVFLAELDVCVTARAMFQLYEAAAPAAAQ